MNRQNRIPRLRVVRSTAPVTIDGPYTRRSTRDRVVDGIFWALGVCLLGGIFWAPAIYDWVAAL